MKTPKVPKWMDYLGDNTNIAYWVDPNNDTWITHAYPNGWSIQIHKVNGIGRLISPDQIRVARGTMEALTEKMNRLTSDEFLQPGDIFGTRRSKRKGLRRIYYEHYGIYIGNHRVIHYNEESDRKSVV